VTPRGRFRLGVGLLTAALAAGIVGANRWRDGRARTRVRLETAVAAARAVRTSATPVSSFGGYRVTVLSGDDLPAATLDSLRRDEAAREIPDGAIAPLKDADDWDVIGAVRLTAAAGAERARSPWRWSWLAL